MNSRHLTRPAHIGTYALPGDSVEGVRLTPGELTSNAYVSVPGTSLSDDACYEPATS
jgi:hypothetical protein